METDILDESNGSISAIQENGLHLTPLSPDESGEGLPYAPENWPNPGDNWSWKVGKRVAVTGHYLDRYLYLPNRLCRLESTTRRKHAFASKLSVERYIKTAFPGTDVDAFFALFSWRIPAKQSAIADGFVQRRTLFAGPHEQTEEHSAYDSQSDAPRCKAGNTKCSSLLLEEGEKLLPGMSCDLCCSEPRFCRDCCCILCSKSVDLAYGGYSYIKCLEKVNDKNICGHVSHLDCALRSHMAGTVGGSIGLDAEYFCRRCDGRTDLVLHVKRLLETCESIDSQG
ncbi:protein OBERON 1-like [Quillaja saponaria]|uniref:Protein OBERON 1-like n=1 Tax=Quillaja saponaria TaxID=32244 RepID=A0AAD7LB52_QUISA|nr:protein OBERON 1-like [Quillaja saponaria]